MVSRLLVTAALLAIAAAAASNVLAAREPNRAERVALAQAVFDYYWPNRLLGRVRVTSIRVSTALKVPGAVGSRTVKTYAIVSTRAWDASGQDLGFEYALAALYVKPNAGWHVFSSGTSDVGCENRFYPLGTRRSIMRDLRVRCSD